VNEAHDHIPPEKDTAGGSSHRPDTQQLSSSLADLARLPSDTTGLRPTLTHIAELAVTAIPGAEGAGVTLQGGAGEPETIVASTPFVADVDAIQYGMGEGPCISAAAQRITVRSGHLGDESQWPNFGSRASEIGVHSVLSLPLLLADDALGVVGAINVYARPRNAFNDRAQELGEIFAHSAAVAVRTAQILDHSRRLAARVQQALPRQAVIDQAVGILVARHGSTPDAAFAQLSATSMRTRTSLLQTAQRLLDETAPGGDASASPTT
jgi:GAF domain-containing protein